VIKRWHILGAGAMGRLLACKMQRVGLSPCLLFREGDRRALAQPVSGFEAESELSLEATGTPALAPEEIDGLWVTTKATDVVTALERVLPALAEGAPVILMHNGMGVLESLAERHPDLHPYSAITTDGAYLQPRAAGAEPLLVHAGEGSTRVGRQGDTPTAWFTDLQQAGLNLDWDTNIQAALWEKLLINCAINPLTALHRCRNGELAENPEYRAEVEGLCRELAAVSRARGFACEDAALLAKTLHVIQGTAANQSSMLQDVLAGRPTELPAITGYLLAEAARLSVPCPLNADVFARLDAATPSH